MGSVRSTRTSWPAKRPDNYQGMSPGLLDALDMARSLGCSFVP